jgi:hypothetical protein
MYNKELLGFLLHEAGFQITASGENEFHRLFNDVDFRRKNKNIFTRAMQKIKRLINKKSRFSDILLEHFNFPEIFVSGRKPK